MQRSHMKKLLPAGLVVDHLSIDRRQIEIFARAVKGWAACPKCGARSGRVHSGYCRLSRDNLVETRASIWMRFYVAVSLTVSA
jgi:hypothetical protein